MDATGTGPLAQLGRRDLFTTLQAQAYLAHAGISPISDPVRTAMREVVDRACAHGVAAFGNNLEIRAELRGRLASLIETEPENLGFVLNTGHGLAAIATALPLRPGDRIALMEGEYPSNVSVFQQIARRTGASVVWLKAGDFAVDTEAALGVLAHELARGLRLVAVSAVQFSSGLQMPLERIGSLCRHYGTWFSVDAVQALGAVPLSMGKLPVDFMACGAHKWLMGAEGAGFVYVHPAAMERLQPVLVGHMSHRGAMEVLLGDPEQLHYQRPLLTKPEVFEGGMLSSVGLAALNAAVGLIQSIGVSAVFDHLQAYHDRLEPLLLERGFVTLRSQQSEQRSGMLCLRPPAGVHAGLLAAGLAARGVYVSSPDGVVRFAPHWPNDLNEVPCVVQAIDSVIADGSAQV